MSRFIDLLEKAGQQAPPSLGFARASGGQGPAPQIILVARLLPKDLAKAPGLAKADVDAFLVALDGEKLGAPKGLRERLWGGRLEEFSSAQVKQLTEKGCDFIVFESMDTEAAVLNEEDLGTIVTISSDLPEEVIRSTCELPVDAVLFSPSLRSLPLTVEQLVAIQRVRGLTDKHFIVEAPLGLGQADMEALRNLGVAGVIVDIPPLDKLSEVKGSIENLPRRKARPSQRDALIPEVGARSAESAPVPEEDGDEDDFD